MSPVTLATVTTPAEYAVAVTSVPPIVTVTEDNSYPASGVSVMLYAVPSSTAVAGLLAVQCVSASVTERIVTVKSYESVRS